MGIIRDSFVMFKNWFEAIEALPEEYQLEAYKSLSKYGLTGVMPENISSVTKAILISFSKGMENNIARYNASVENGKKGGRPKKDQLEEPRVKNENLEKPNETKKNLDEPTQNLNVNDNVNVNVNDICLLNNNACAQEIVNKSEDAREPYLKFFNETFDFYKEGKFYDAAIEIVDTMIDARSQAICNGLKFNHKTYSEKELLQTYFNLDNEKFRKIATQVALNKEIQDKPRYIMGCIFNAGQKESPLNSNSKLEEFEQNLGGD